MLKVKVAELVEIKSVDEASAKIDPWLDGYVQEHGLTGQRFIIGQVDIIKERDGWYAIMAIPPQPVPK